MKSRGGRQLPSGSSSGSLIQQKVPSCLGKMRGGTISNGMKGRMAVTPVQPKGAKRPQRPTGVLKSTPAADEKTEPETESENCNKEGSASMVTAPSGFIRIRRSAEVRSQHQDRFNLDRRQLTSFPLLEGEERLKLLNVQSNYITQIQNLHLPSLVFLDLYNNSIKRISGLEGVPSLRVLMLGKNALLKLEGLAPLPQLDVLDLHNNSIETIEGLSHLAELRVLNLAGNKLAKADGLNGLRSLTELNLRRNQITEVDIGGLYCLQRIFLSNNMVSDLQNIQSVFKLKALTELTLDGNPLGSYRQTVIEKVKTIKHIDLKRVTEEEKRVALLHAKREEEKAIEKNKKEAAATERNETLQNIKQSWDGDRHSTECLKCIVDLNQETGLLSVKGSGADLSSLPSDQTGVSTAAFQYIPISKVCEVFVPHLATLPGVKGITLSHNYLFNFNQLAALALLPSLEQLTIVENKLSSTPRMARELSGVLLPHLTYLNGVAITEDDKNSGFSRFGSYFRLLSVSVSHLSRARHLNGKSPPVSPPKQDAHPAHPSRRVASHYVNTVLAHASAIDAKIQLLNQQWDLVLGHLAMAAVSSGPVT